MRRLAIALVVLTSLLCPAVASARRVPIPVPAPKVIHQPCPKFETAGGCFEPADNTIWIRPDADRFALQHEYGHAFDATRLNDGERNRFLRYIRHVGSPWHVKDPLEVGGISRDSPNEQFADAYANCALGNGVRHRSHGVIEFRWESSTTYMPWMSLHKRVCAFLWRAARQP
jgi:hypothetical protein